MSTKVLLLYGSGARVGTAILNKFSSNGWKTAAIVRTMRPEYKDTADVVLQCDFSDAQSVQKVYNEVEGQLGTPSCVVYNAYAYESFNEDPSNPFRAPVEAYARDLAVNTVSLYAAASSATAGFAKLATGPKSFIYTGNNHHSKIVPEQPGLASGKTASAYLIELASKASKDSQWYFADERSAAGKSVLADIDAQAHGDMYYYLASSEKQLPWNHTFVKGKGYVKFPDVVDREYTPLKALFAEASKGMDSVSGR